MESHNNGVIMARPGPAFDLHATQMREKLAAQRKYIQQMRIDAGMNPEFIEGSPTGALRLARIGDTPPARFRDRWDEVVGARSQAAARPT